MSSAKRKPRTPSPLEDEGLFTGPNQEDSYTGQNTEDSFTGKNKEDSFAGRKLSVSEFDSPALLDYDAVASPSASSTSSEPSYVRQPGFEHHAHEVPVGRSSHTQQSDLKTQKNLLPKRIKKKKCRPDEGCDMIAIDVGPSVPSTRPKIKKEPLPMKLRDLPPSFWVQPNRASCLPPSGTLLPPLLLGKDYHDVTDVRPVTPPEVGEQRVCRGDGSKYSVSSPSPTLSSHSLLNLHHSPSSSSIISSTINTSPSSSSLSALASQTSSSSSQPKSSIFTGSLHSPPPDAVMSPNIQPCTSPTSLYSASQSPTMKHHPSYSSQSSCPALFGDLSQSPHSSSPILLSSTKSYQERRGETIIKVGNTDLLFSLFDKVEQGDRRKLQLLKRTRVRKGSNPPPVRHHRDDDPCLVGAVTEGLLPLLDSTPHSSGASTPLGTRHTQQVVEMVNLKGSNRTWSLPSLNVEPNYSQMLSELVMKL
ncbi:uncharacterized protein LOC108666470 [Hyalella azteca]|uniref:Uncharacterized protein LOC108666470 n=1 Tax=Hyalella azteca TaxID=294128 RepID=A0A8B7N4R9_HYAAZ|nr:uncharacterized protein LOC108666470 [Hyalella azteca]